jgi:hypothetical protein
VRLRGEPIELSAKEFALLRALASDPTRVFTKEELLRDVWGYRSLGTTRTLDSHACRLRHKLGLRGDKFVVNVWGQSGAKGQSAVRPALYVSGAPCRPPRRTSPPSPVSTGTFASPESAAAQATPSSARTFSAARSRPGPTGTASRSPIGMRT